MNKWKSIAATAATALTVNANAEVDMFLTIESPTIEGEADDPLDTFDKSIDVLAWSWGLSNNGTQHVGGSGGAGKSTIQDLLITKYIDKSTIQLYERLTKGDTIGKATLSVRKPGKMPFVNLEIVIEDLIVSSASTGGASGEDRLTENLTFNFAKVTTKYTPQQGDNPITYCYDIQANAEC